MSNTASARAWSARVWYATFMVVISFIAAIGLLLWQPWSASAAVSEESVVDLVKLNGKDRVKPGAFFPIVKFNLAPTASENLVSTTFRVNNVSGFVAADLNSNGSTAGGSALLIVRDTNNNGSYDQSDTAVGGLRGTQFAVGTTTIDIDTDLNFGNGLQYEVISTSSYFVVAIISATSTEGHVFSVTIPTGTAAYIVTSTAVTSAGLNTANVTIDATAPTQSGNAMPPNGQEFVPLDTFVKMVFSERITTSTVTSTPTTTSTVRLQANTGNTQSGAPAGTNLCNSIVLESAGTMVSCLHATLSTSTWYTMTFTTGTQDIAGNVLAVAVSSTFKTGDLSAQNNVTPPFVVSTVPTNANTSFPTNGIIYVELPASLSGVMSVSGAGSATSTSNVLLQAVSNGAPTGSNLLTNNNQLSILGAAITSPHWLQISPPSLTANTDYALTIKKNVTNFNGVPFNNDFILKFKTSAGNDSTPPTISSITPASSTTGVAHNIGDVVVNYSKDMNGATITTTSLRFFKDANSNSVLDANEWWSASTTVRYDSMQKAAHIGLKTILAANSQYCIHAATSTDLAGNALTSAVRCFTSNAAAFSATSPTVMFADADNFKLWVSFDQPVDPGDAETAANYTIESPIGTTLNLTNAALNYRPEGKGVEITSIGLTTGQQYKVTVTGIRDLSAGATIVANGTTNVAKGVVQDSTKTGGLVGGLDKADFTQTNFGTFWQNPQRCAPSSSGAGKKSRLMCEFPAPAALSSGAQVILTFPTGFDINVMGLIATSSSQMNADLNSFGPGVTTIAGMATNTAANTVTLTLTHTTSTAMTSNDQLRFELDNLINHATAGSYSVTIVIKDSSGIKQGQTITAAPFMVNTAGSLAIAGKVCKGTTSGGACAGDDTGISGAKVFLDSPASGHMETSTAAGGTYTFPGLTAGQYGVGVFIDPSVSADLGGGNNFQSVNLSGANATGIDFKKTDVSSSGKTLTFVITGGPATTDMDVFCFAPSSVQFSAPVMKMVTTNGSGATTTALKVQPNTTYQCGVGPHMPFDSISSGAAPTMPDFSFVPPPPERVVIGTSNATTTIALTVATEQIIGKITDGTGTAIANVYVDARPTGCFDTTTGALKDCRGGMAQSKTDGKFVLKVTAGTYQVSACAPGMPCSSPVEVTVKANSSNVDNNTAADVYMGGTLITSANGAVIRMVKSDLTIAGQVLDESGNALKYAFVNARKVGSSDTCTSYTSQGGDTGSPTDSQGNYTLYVTNTSTWRVEAYAGSYGSVGCSIITLTNSSLSSQNIQATASAYGTISGTVTRDSSTSTQGAQVNCFGSSGGNQTIVGANGTYSMKVKAGTYTCDGFIPGSGSLTPATGVVVAGSGTATANLSMGNPGKIVVALGSTMTDAFCDARSSSGYGNGTSQNSSGTYTINVPAGTYTVRCGNPRTGELGSQSVTATAGATSTVTFTAPTLFTITGRVTDGSSNLEGASITLADKTNGRIIFKQADATSGSNANVSVTLPAGTYSVVASKAGYVDADSAQSLVVSANTTFTTRSLTKATATASVTVQSDGVNYTGQAKVIATRSSDSKVVTGDVDATVTSTANATLALTTGSWSLQAFGDNGKRSAATTITVTGASVSASPTLSLSTAITGFTSSQNQQSMVPSNGGLFKDSGINSKFEINIPAGALSTSDATEGTIETKTNATYAISTPGKSFLGAAAIDITPKNSSGQKISDLSSAVTFTIPYSEADIPSGVDEQDLLCAAWSDASQEWETLPTTVDTTNNILTCQTTHFSTFGAIAPTSGGTVAASSNTTSPSSGGGGSAATVPVPVVRGTASPVIVNNGALETTSRLVELHFAVDKATQMAISNTPDFTGQSYAPYSDKKTWELTAGTGQKTVYVRFRSSQGGMLVTSVTVNLVDKIGTVVAPVDSSAVRQPVTMIKIVPAASARIKDLKPGSRGADVLALQAKLKALGHLSKSIKSVDSYGPATVAAVKRFQKVNKLPMNGIFSGKTAALLNGSTDSSAATAPTSAPVSLSPLPSPMPTPPGVFKNLRQGSRGANVIALQKKLKALGFLSPAIKSMDSYGPATTAAVKRFQKANKISQTGGIGPLTLSALNRQ